MKKFYTTLTGLSVLVLSLFGQSYLTPAEGHKVAYFFSDTVSVRTFDVNEGFFYFNDGDTVFQIDATLRGVGNKYGKPADYQLPSFPSFLSIAPDGAFLWAGYTDIDNADARIYAIDVTSGRWNLMARMASNWDLAFWNDSILVSGLNSPDYNTPNAIYVLDTSGLDHHRKIIETGGNSAGLAVDSHGNLYFGTSFLSGSNALYRWDSTELASVIGSPEAAPLQLSDADKLADLPMAVYDCEVDEGENVVFTMNVWGGSQVLARWNGTEGAGYNYDTIALSDEWLGMVKSRGDYRVPEVGNSLLTIGYNQPLADVHTVDYAPFLTGPVPVITGYESGSIGPIDLSRYVTDLDDPDDFIFEIVEMSDITVADLSVDQTSLSGNFGSAGQANLVMKATSGGKSVTLSTVVGTWPGIEGDYMVSVFEDLTLDPESFWNGSDGSGGFVSAAVRFRNNYNPDWFSWSGFAYSNRTDMITPGWMNQYSAITGSGFDTSGNYAVGYPYAASVLSFTENKAHAVEGLFVTNSTTAALSMASGDDFAKKFGGEDGSDPDYFRLDIWGLKEGVPTDTIGFYLADFRSEDEAADYIIKTWQWVDLSALGKVDSLMFALASSDMGDWGMNTPGYFCLDNLYVIPDMAPEVLNPIPDVNIQVGAADTVIDLTDLFTDPDDPGAVIQKSVISNSNEEVAGTSLNGDELTLSASDSQGGTTEIIIEGTSGGLSVRDSFLVTVQPAVGMDEKQPFSIGIFPNPSTGLFTLDTGEGDLLQITVYNLAGTAVYENSTPEPGETIDITDQPTGVYILRVTLNMNTVTSMIQKL